MTDSFIKYKATETGNENKLPDAGISVRRVLALRAMSRALERYDATGYLADGGTFLGLTGENLKKIPFGWVREKDAPVIKPDTDNEESVVADEGIKAKNYFEALLKDINKTGDVFGPNAGGIVEPAAKEDSGLSSSADVFAPSKP